MQKRYVVKKRLTVGKLEYRDWNNWEDGDLAICQLHSFVPNKLSEGRLDIVVQVLEAAFKNKEEEKRVAGKMVKLNSVGMLSKALDGVEENTIFQVVYTGKNKIEKGKYKGKESHTMEVTLMEEESPISEDIEVSEESNDDL